MSDSQQSMPAILITGISGGIGQQLRKALADKYQVVGIDVKVDEQDETAVQCDLTDPDSVNHGLDLIRQQVGDRLAAVIHLAAYFDFSGEHSPLYDKVNVEGTRNLMRGLQSFMVERFIYSSTMLVHQPGVVGEKINEDTPIGPGWAYPESKAKTEAVIREERGDMPVLLLRLAGLYDDESAVPTLSHQIARIYERNMKSHLYSGDLNAGQAFIHLDDMMAVFRRAVERRNELPENLAILAGEDQVLGYQALQNRIGALVHGKRQWATISVPAAIAKPGAWMETKAEPLVPDAIDQGEPPFIKPFMIDLASDHYDLDITRARALLDWEPTHNIWFGLEKMVASLKRDPVAWYERNGVTVPQQLEQAQDEKGLNPHQLLQRHQARYQQQHQQSLWAHFINLALAAWLITSPFALGYESGAMMVSDVGAGLILAVTALLSLSWRMSICRWLSGAVGLWLLAAPLVFWAPTAAAYMNDTLVGMLVLGFALLVRPAPGIAPLAAESGPTVPPGWDYSPSEWLQRLPIIMLAVIGFLISRYLCAYQLGHIEAVWDPFFGGAAGDGSNGTEQIITSSVSKAWPVPDAGLGAMTYALEIVTGIMGSNKRWRTMPWLVMTFGILIVPLGAVSIFFIIIQPVVIGTWCTLCLVAAAAMLLQIPYSLDEVIASGEYLYRRKQRGHSLLLTLFRGDTDDGGPQQHPNPFRGSAWQVLKGMTVGGITLPWNLLLCLPIGIWLMFTRLTLDHSGGMANADHMVGALVLTVVVTSLAETARALRLLLIPLGLVLMMTPFVYGAAIGSIVAGWICGLLLIALALPRGTVKHHYGRWDYCIA